MCGLVILLAERTSASTLQVITSSCSILYLQSPLPDLDTKKECVKCAIFHPLMLSQLPHPPESPVCNHAHFGHSFYNYSPQAALRSEGPHQS